MRFLEAARINSSFALSRSRFARACASRLRKIFDAGFALPRLRFAGTSVAIVVALTISAPSSAVAQAGVAAPAAAPAQSGRGTGAGGGTAQGGGPGGLGGAPPYPPAHGAKDLKAVM